MISMGHSLVNSFRLFRPHRSFLQIIINFSWRHRLHFLLTLLNGWHLFRTFHLILKGLFASLRVQTCSVQFRFLCLCDGKRSGGFFTVPWSSLPVLRSGEYLRNSWNSVRQRRVTPKFVSYFSTMVLLLWSYNRQNFRSGHTFEKIAPNYRYVTLRTFWSLSGGIKKNYNLRHFL